MAEPDDTIAALAPVLWWKLDEASGTVAADSSAGGTFDGTLSGGVTFGATGMLPGSASTGAAFDGVDGLITLAADPIIGDTWSVILFIRHDDDGAGTTLPAEALFHGDAADHPTFIDDTKEMLRLRMGIFFPPSLDTRWTWYGTDEFGTFDFGTSSDDYPNTAIKMLALTLSPGATRAGEDGVLPIPFGREATTYSARELRLGMAPDGLEPFKGQIQHLAIFDYALSTQDVEDVWVAAGFTAPTHEFGDVHVSDYDNPPTYEYEIPGPEGVPPDDPASILTVEGAEDPVGPEPSIAPAVEFPRTVDGAEDVPPGPLPWVPPGGTIEVGTVDGAEVPPGPEPTPGDLDLPSIDGFQTLFGPVAVELFDPDSVIDIDLPSIDGASPVKGPVVDLYPPVADDPYLPIIRGELRTAGGVLLDPLLNIFGLEWQDPLNELGSGSFSLPADDPACLLVTPGVEVWCYLYDVLVYTFIVATEPSLTAISEGEESSQDMVGEGGGRASLFDEVLIYPVKGLAPQVMGQHRIYSFASPDFPNGDGWPAAVPGLQQKVINPVRYATQEWTFVTSDFDDVVEEFPAPAPLSWLVGDAYWIWGTEDTLQEGFNYFRSTFTLDIATPVVIAATADNYWTLYLDGTPILGETGDGIGWLEYKTVEITLPPGTYYLAAVVENIPFPFPTPPEWNPAGFLCAVYTVDTQGDLLDVIKVSDASWTCLAYPPSAPGWTPGQIILDARDEGQARGLLSAFETSFGPDTDSSGQAWIGTGGYGSFVPGFSVPIGATMADMLEGLVKEGWIDYRVLPGGKVLEVFSQGNLTVDNGVVLNQTGVVATSSIVSQSFDPQGKPITRILVKWSSGFMEVDNPAAIGVHGLHEGFLTVDAENEVEARRQALLVVNEIANPQTAISVETDPTMNGDQPYIDYAVGESVSIPARVGGGLAGGNLEPHRLVSISVSQDDMGKPRIVLEFDFRVVERERKPFELLAELGRGVAGNTKVRSTLTTTSTTNHG